MVNKSMVLEFQALLFMTKKNQIVKIENEFYWKKIRLCIVLLQFFGTKDKNWLEHVCKINLNTTKNLLTLS